MIEHENFSANKLLLAFSYLLAEKISYSAEHEKSFIIPGPGVCPSFI